jgi:hypothetical protein
MKYKLVSGSEVHDFWILKRQVWWIFYSYVGAGSRAVLENWVKEKGGTIV